jgi:hypothetical protein
MTSQLSWQPPPVTKCGECPNKRRDINWNDFCGEGDKVNWYAYSENKDGITQSCPMWRQQNEEVK